MTDPIINKQPLVSVIMLSFNALNTIEAAVNCIIAQTYTNWELIISDGASTDGTQDWLKRLTHPQIRIVLNKTRKGYIRDKNETFQLAKGELVTQLDSDDLCPVDRLALQVDAFIRHPDINVVAGAFRLINMEGDVITAEKDHAEDFLITEIQDEYPFWFASVMFRKKLFEEFGYFSEYFAGFYGDDNYWITKVNAKYPILVLKKPVYFYRSANPNSISHTFDNPRKLIVGNILLELKRQQRLTGTDWLTEGREDLMQEFEQEVFANKKIMSEKYRMWAATAVDKGDKKAAKNFLKKSFFLNPLNTTWYKTYLYYLRKAL